MDYQKIYDNIIQKAQKEDRVRYKIYNPKYIYFERHHIIPKCLGGSDEKENLILLKAKEHYICHKLLNEIHPKNYKIFLAYKMMACKCDSGNQKRKYNVSVSEYGRLKQIESELRIEYFKDEENRKKNGEFTKLNFNKKETKLKHIESQRKRWEDPKEREKSSLGQFKRYIDNPDSHPMYGHKHTEEARKRMSESHKGKKPSEETLVKLRQRRHTEETKAKMSATRQGIVLSQETKDKISEAKKKFPTVICPHCGKEGKYAGMKVWHFDHCKYKKEVNYE
jgi:hypothetical protein